MHSPLAQHPSPGRHVDGDADASFAGTPTDADESPFSPFEPSLHALHTPLLPNVVVPHSGLDGSPPAAKHVSVPDIDCVSSIIPVHYKIYTNSKQQKNV